MIKTLFLALMVCFSSSQTHLIYPNDPSAHMALGEHCTLAEPKYCHCTVTTIEGKTLKTRWFRIDPSMEACDEAAQRMRLSAVNPRKNPEAQVCDDQGHVQRMHNLPCDLRIETFYIDAMPHQKKIQLSLVIATQQDPSDLLLQVVAQNTGRVPSWLTIDQRHALLIIDHDRFMSDDAQHRALTVHTLLGRCSDTIDVAFDFKLSLHAPKLFSRDRSYPRWPWMPLLKWMLLPFMCGINGYIQYETYHATWHTISLREKINIISPMALMFLLYGICVLYRDKRPQETLVITFQRSSHA